MANNPVTLDLEKLQQEYNIQLTLYKAAIADYMAQINKTRSLDGKKEFIGISGTAYPGTGTAGNSTAKTVQDCIISCGSNAKCSGATFVPNVCSLRTGDSSIVAASDDSYSIISIEKLLLLYMETLNLRLISINEKIRNKIKVSEPIYNEVNSNKSVNSQELKDTYTKLNEERKNIKELLHEYDTLENTEKEEQLVINRNYYSYILLLLLVVFFVYFLIKITVSSISTTYSYRPIFQYGGTLNYSAYFYVILLVVAIVIVNMFMRK